MFDTPPVADCQQAATPIGVETRPGDIRFGAFSLTGGYLRDEPRRKFDPNADGEYPVWKVAAILARGKRARLRVAERDRRNASFMYAEPRPDGHYLRIRQGRQVEYFAACRDRDYTPWPGALMLRGPRCVTLEARVGRGEWVGRRVGRCRKPE